ncbi:SPOR domain-containing protein [Lysobacter sp. 5GHs7-4]|uniref:SPOR domain-containing protein n=1 Tax=Lysobacter sp. 5GHs7-4 TaxID=2904253 RepID=UPI001E489A9D|nr:SPOR domain-containing protein [Lysobacter sp. 5GHs7-4]UHQ23669.1 SPOR domain-containing protein [Lysobacter sp. 5GHs7-4]
MAARRGKSQAKRNQGNSGGLPGWAWGVIGVLLGVVLILSAPKFLKSDGDGFFRPKPNPDAQPAPVAVAEDETVAPDGDAAPTQAKPAADAPKQGPEYDFYTLLPGKEVPLTDAELAATERAEAQRLAQQQKQQAAQAAAQNATTPANPATPTAANTAAALPKPVDAGPATPAASAPAANTVATAAPAAAGNASAAAATPVDDNTRYLLQAGAFQASGQAEEMKAKIAMLGLGARVEEAQIGGKTVYRVRMGPYGTASDLADAKRKLSSGGLPGLAIKVK